MTGLFGCFSATTISSLSPTCCFDTHIIEGKEHILLALRDIDDFLTARSGRSHREKSTGHCSNDDAGDSHGSVHVLALFLGLKNELKSTGPTELPVGLCHKKTASTFRPLPDRRPAIYRSIQNEHNAVSRNVNRSFTGCLFRAASFPRTTFWTCSLPRSSVCGFGALCAIVLPPKKRTREGAR